MYDIIQFTSAGTPSSSAVDRVGAVRRWEQNVTGVTLATQCARLVTAATQQWLTSRADRFFTAPHRPVAEARVTVTELH